MSSQPTAKANANAVLVAGVVLVLTAVVAYIFCELRGISSVPVLGFIGPFAGALLIAQRLDKVQQTAAEAREQATTAVRQTNGELTTKVRSIVSEVIAEHQVARDASRAALAATLPPPQSGQ